MSRILAYTSPSCGQLFPLAAILDELHRRGHEISLRTLETALPQMRARGFEAEATGASVAAIEVDDWRARTPPGAMIQAARVFAARAAHEARDLDAAIAAVRPDALLVDVIAQGALAAAEAWGGPWAVTCTFPPLLPSRFGPPVGPGLRPARGRLGRIRDRAVEASSNLLLARISLAAVNPVRSERGLPPFERPAQILTAPPLFLYASAEPFEYRRPDWPASVMMVGPCTWEPPGELPKELAGVEMPLVLVNTSTEFQDDSRLAEVAFEALAGEALHVVATIPTGDASRLRPPANGTALGFAPHAPILARAACAITHGGMGATQKALSCGIPVCVVPFGRDQYEVARRVEVNEAGARLPSPLLNPARLRRAVRKALGRREGAQRVAAGFAAAGGPGAAADAIEARLL